FPPHPPRRAVWPRSGEAKCPPLPPSPLRIRAALPPRPPRPTGSVPPPADWICAAPPPRSRLAVTACSGCRPASATPRPPLSFAPPRPARSLPAAPGRAIAPPSAGAALGWRPRENRLAASAGRLARPNVGRLPWCKSDVAPTSQSRPTVGREKDKSKSVSFALSDASVTPTDIDSEMCNFSNSCNDKLTDENVSNSSQQMAERRNITEEQYSNDQECTDNDCWNQEVEPLDHAVEQQPESYVGETGSSMKLRSRKKLQKAPTHTADDYFGEDCVEPSLAEEDNDSGDAGTKRKVRKRSRDGVEESQKQKAQKDKSQVSSRGRKRTSKDKLAEKPEKLTHRIRQRRTKEVKTLLETPREEIDPMKLSAAHLRLLQEARERVNTPSGPSSNTSFGLEDIDDFDYRGEEARNFDNERTDNHLQNVPKLNYHSYMNKPTRGKWSKSDTDLFYQGLRQFGSDFAMIQQLFPDKTRHQVRQKFKSEEKKNPLLVHDAIIHRSGDNQYFKKVIKQLNIEDVLPEINNTNKQDGASSEGSPGNENVLDDFTNEDDFDFTTEGDGSNAQMSGVQEGHVSGNDDDLGDVFDWY
ncbi:hypothetical protein U9M48_015609, partial [Paspalum notatum var. saurae]